MNAVPNITVQFQILTLNGKVNASKLNKVNSDPYWYALLLILHAKPQDL